VLEAANARIVRRTNALLGYPWGRDFRYDEAVVTGRGTGGRARATAIAAGLATANRTLEVDLLRPLVERMLPGSGTGPDEETRRTGFFRHVVIAEHPRDPSTEVRVEVVSTRDPYTATGWMAAEAAIVLATGQCAVGGGVWTPASALGSQLRDNLETHAGVTFTPLD
jgi:short subunit dehydrogenase-like uncharacterized protein